MLSTLQHLDQVHSLCSPCCADKSEQSSRHITIIFLYPTLINCCHSSLLHKDAATQSTGPEYMDEAACKGAHLGWNYYLTTEPTTCIHNSKNFVYSQTMFHHVSVAATTIVREVYFCEPKHSCCKLPMSLIMRAHTHTHTHTHRFTLRPHEHRMHLSKLRVDGDPKWISVSIGQIAYNCSVLVRRGGLPWQWLCLPLKHVRI